MKDILKEFLVAGSCLCLVACGTINTVNGSARSIASDLRKQHTSCTSLPRVYSGLMYDFCNLHANPDTVPSEVLLSLYLLDGAASAMTDTLLLPYTGYQQYRYGSINLVELREVPDKKNLEYYLNR